jgi:hypothetical protein
MFNIKCSCGWAGQVESLLKMFEPHIRECSPAWVEVSCARCHEETTIVSNGSASGALREVQRVAAWANKHLRDCAMSN